MGYAHGLGHGSAITFFMLPHCSYVRVPMCKLEMLRNCNTECRHNPASGAQADLIKDNGHHYFIKFLEAPDAGTTAETRAQAAFVLAIICHGCGPGRSNCRAHQVASPLQTPPAASPLVFCAFKRCRATLRCHCLLSAGCASLHRA